MSAQEKLKYTKEHEWVRIEGNEAVVGITEFAQGELGDIVFVEVETVGEELSAGDTFGTIEAVKTVSDMYMPVSGEITEFNTKLEDTPELINSDPFGEGWIIKIAITGDTDTSELLDYNQYKELINA